MKHRIFVFISILIHASVSHAQIDDSKIQQLFADYFYMNCDQVRISAQWDDFEYNRNSGKMEFFCDDRLLIKSENGVMDLKMKFDPEIEKIITDAPLGGLMSMFENILTSSISPFEIAKNTSKTDEKEQEANDVLSGFNIKSSNNSKHAIYQRKSPTVSQIKKIRSALLNYIEDNCSSLIVGNYFGTTKKIEKEPYVSSSTQTEPSIIVEKIQKKKTSKKDRKSKKSYPSPGTQDYFPNVAPSTTQKKYEFYKYLTLSCNDEEEIFSNEKDIVTKIDFEEEMQIALKMKFSEWFFLIYTVLDDESSFNLVPKDTVKINESRLKSDGTETHVVKFRYVKRYL